MKKYLFLLFVISGILSAQETYNLSLIKSNMEFLASDLMEGREASTHSEKIAARFIASELMKNGIMPYGDNGTYFQTFDLDQKKLNPASKLVIYDDESKPLGEFKPVKDFVGEIRNMSKEIAGKPLQMVFCGYGISDEELGYDDYKDIDVKGKIAVVCFGVPSDEYHEGIDAKGLRKYYSPVMKVAGAAKNGAEAILFVPDDMIERMWGMLAGMTIGAKLSIPGTPSREMFSIPILSLRKDDGQIYFNDDEISFDELSEQAKEGKPLKKFYMKRTVSLDFEFDEKVVESQNIVGIIEGKNKNEFVSLGAHYDHIGMSDTLVNNGADDNASGTCAVIETARRLAENNDLDRSVLVLLYGAEEKGLLGSRFFVKELENKDDFLLNINVDMCGREVVDTIFVRGPKETSAELVEIVKNIDAEYEGMDFLYEEGLTDGMSSSDHTSFAAVGIPVVCFGDNMERDLHRPTDDYDKINYEKIGRTSLVIEKIARKVANLDHKLTRN